jgi:NAD(P)-dependent dehydrogenase (short-subunit alcohol dehydrogenase family)
MIPEPEPPVAVVTGGAGALGTAVRDALVAAGLTVHAPGHTELDVCDPDAVRHYFAALPAIDLLVANAGVAHDALLARMDSSAWETVLQTNLTGAFRCARAVARPMARARTGHIITIGSTSALTGPAGQANYAAAKAGLLGLTKSLAHELGPRGIRANCVLPGFLETPFTARITEKRRAEILDAHALPHPNTCTHAARFIAFLHTSMPHTSGQVFSLDSRIQK